eukprot:SM000334S12543  [mRNA]  locus=s334:24154:27375:- [translate_table: standard]
MASPPPPAARLAANLLLILAAAAHCAAGLPGLPELGRQAPRLEAPPRPVASQQLAAARSHRRQPGRPRTARRRPSRARTYRRLPSRASVLARRPRLPVGTLSLARRDWSGGPSTSNWRHETAVDSAQRPGLQDEPGGGVKKGLPGMLATLSERGLTYVKDVLIEQVLEELTPLHVPDIRVRVSFKVGHVDLRLSRITLLGALVPNAEIDLGDSGVTIFASGVVANITLDWHVVASGGIVPVSVKDHGYANVRAQGVQAGVTAGLETVNGALNLTVMQHGCYIDDLQIHMHGGASIIYNWLAQGFHNHLRAAVETAINKAVLRATKKLDMYLHDLPRKVPVDDTLAIDVTLVEDPIVKSKYMSFALRGEFLGLSSTSKFPFHPPSLPEGAFCGASERMLTITISGAVLNSATAAYYEEGSLDFLVTYLPDGSPFKMNTGSWMYVLPRLYLKYPNRPMALRLVATSAPAVNLTEDGARASAAVDMYINVYPNDTKDDSVTVACVNLAVTVEGLMGISGNNLTGEAHMDDLTLSLEWSDIGYFPMRTVQAAVRTVVNIIIIPMLNRSLQTGHSLPVLPGVALRKAKVTYAQDYLLVCTDVEYTGGAPQGNAASSMPLATLVNHETEVAK